MVSEEIKDYYKVKLSLLQLDSQNQSEQSQGLERLKALSFDTKSVAHDQALFHLGHYFWIKNKFSEAKNYWQQFIVKYGNDMTYDSLIRVVQEKLDLIAL